MKHPVTRALHAYWNSLRAGRAAPERGDLNPGAIRTLLGDVFLLDLDGAARHRLRLAGTRICTLLGREWKGSLFTEPFAAAERPEVFGLLDGVVANAVPAVAGIAAETADGRRLDLELLLLPLRHRGRTDARLLGSLVAGDWPYWAGVVPLVRFRLVSVRHLRAGSGADDIALAAPALRALPGRLRLLTGGRT